MGSRGQDYEKNVAALDAETAKVASRLLSDFKSTSTFRVVERGKNLNGMKLLGLIDPAGTEKDVSKSYWKLKPFLEQVTDSDLLDGESMQGQYQNVRKIAFEHEFPVETNGRVEMVDFYIKAYYDPKMGKTMVDSIHPKQMGSRTGHRWDEHTNRLWRPNR